MLPTPEGTAVTGVTRLDGDDLLVSVTGWVKPMEVLRYTAKDGQLSPTALKKEVPVDLSGYEVVREECTSKDGTKVPLDIVRKKGLKLDGSNPTWLTGYGGFGISMVPVLSSGAPAWLEQGGVCAMANLRGGAEFGEAWHQAGTLTQKQNVFDDFLACAQRLVEQKYTSPKKLAIQGGSNGGLLMGAALTQHPDLFRAVVSFVGVYDMLRYETTPNGVFNTTEYGSVKDEDAVQGARRLLAAPAREGRGQYPAILLLDRRQRPAGGALPLAQVRRRAAGVGLEAAGAAAHQRPTGHGIGTPLNDRIAELTDVYSFICNELGVKVQAPKATVVPGK